MILNKIKLYSIIFFLNFFSLSNLYSEDYHTFLKNKADQGDAISQNNLGHMYLDGFPDYNIPQNTDKAILYLNKAAAQNQVNAMTTVGWAYFTGEYGATQNFDEAIGWTKKASDLGCSIASYNLGLFYFGGLADLDQDLAEAKRYWLLSASQYIDPKQQCIADPEELLEEINQYVPNPSKKMIELRNFFISLLKSEPI